MHRHAVRIALAVVVVTFLVLLGSLAHALYIRIVHPDKAWALPRHKALWGTAISLGLAAGAIESFYTLSGVRDLYCQNYRGGT